MELDGVLFEEQVPNMQTQLVPHVSFGDNFRFQDNSSHLTFSAQDVYNRNHHALLFSSNTSEDDHLPCFDVIDRGANTLGGTNKLCLDNLGSNDYLDMNCRNVLGHAEVEKTQQISSRGGCSDSNIMAQTATHGVDLGCLTVSTVVKMNSTNGHDYRLDQIMSRFMAPGGTSCIRNSITTSTDQKQMAQVKNTFKAIKKANWIKGKWTLEEDR